MIRRGGEISLDIPAVNIYLLTEEYRPMHLTHFTYNLVVCSTTTQCLHVNNWVEKVTYVK